MFICDTCGEIFEEPKIVKEFHPYGDTYAEENWAVCPHCKDNNFEKAKKCSRCGEYVMKLKDDLCEDCYSDTNE